VKFRAIVIDDEELARKRLKKLLSHYEQEIEVVDEATNGEEALEKIEKQKPDVIFLDIQMPGLTGFQVVQKLKEQPFIIFTTAYDQYALQAFEENSIDYLLKPIEANRLETAISKLRKRSPQRDEFNESLKKLVEKLEKPELKHIRVKVGDKILLVDVKDIVFFDSEEKYTSVHTLDQKYVIDDPLAELEKKLDPADFVRIHRSHIVNIRFIKEIHKWFGGKMKLKLKDARGTELTVSRSYVEKVRSL
jgi:two-component system LytT family response regulator